MYTETFAAKFFSSRNTCKPIIFNSEYLIDLYKDLQYINFSSKYIAVTSLFYGFEKHCFVLITFPAVLFYWCETKAA